MPVVYLREIDHALSAPDAALRLAHRPGLAWLDGGLTYGSEGRWSFLGVDPVAQIARADTDPNALEALKMLETAGNTDLPAGAPLQASDVPAWIGYIAYDAHPFPRAKARHVRAGHGSSGLCFARYDALLGFDHREQRVYVLADDVQRAEVLLAKLSAPAHTQDLTFSVHDLQVTHAADHTRAIARALEAVRDGDVYQINLARYYEARLRGNPLGLYVRMREQSPVPLGLYCALSELTLLGRSMERYLRFERPSGRLWTSPIKGTLAGEARPDAAELARDPKEHAEHAMVVDLMRNDLSRVCAVGSVAIDALMEVVPFAGLYHLISTVSGRVRPDVTLFDVLHETFPPGSVTGTPKQSALSLIEALEPAARGLYTGAYGFVDRTGGCSLAVAIRSATVTGDVLRYGSGGGIVAKSVAARELAETELKARVFLEALGTKSA